MNTKSLEQSFIDWEASVFGFGYGSGEEYIIGELKKFFAVVPESGNYDFQEIEKSLGGPICWLLINTLCHCAAVNYGSSPRFGWLTEKGKVLHKFIISKTIKELAEMVNQNEPQCGMHYCNCDKTHAKGCKNNAFF